MKNIAILALGLIVIFARCSKEDPFENVARKMQEFVANISAYARTLNPNFLIVPQNRIELAFNQIEPGNGPHTAYMSAIDAISLEELFYNGSFAPDNKRLGMLQQRKATKKVMVSEFVSQNVNVTDAIARNSNEGFICFVRTGDNYHYKLIPTEMPNNNPNPISSISAALNYLYLISYDNFSTAQEMLNAIAATNYDRILIDLFFKGTALSPAQVNQLKHKPNGSTRLVICYINTGAAEIFRYYWQNSWNLSRSRWIKNLTRATTMSFGLNSGTRNGKTLSTATPIHS